MNLRKNQFSDTLQTLSNFFKDWPILKTKLGYDLIDQDYLKIYPDSHRSLYNNWQLFIQNIVPILKTELKEKESLQYLNYLEKPNDLSEGLLK